MIRKRGGIAAIAGALLVLAVVSVHGQYPTRIDPDVRKDLASALGVVRPLVRDDPPRAIDMLVALEVDFPGNPQILMLLGEAYRVTGDLERARASYQRCLDAQPTHMQAGAMVGLLYLEAGDSKSSEQTFDGLLKRTEYGLNTYRTIGSTLNQNGYNELALRYYEEGRARSDDDYVLAMDIAFMHRSMGNYEAALAEYLLVVEASFKQHRLVKSKITELLRDSGANQDELLSLLEEDANRKAPYRGVIMEILAAAYLERGMLESALDMAVLADKETNSNGAVLFGVAEMAFHEYSRRQDDPLSTERAAYFDLSLRALEAHLDEYPSSPRVPNAKLMLIDLLVDMATGRVKARPSIDLSAAIARALEAMDWVIASFPGTDHAEQAYLKKGDVVLRLQRKPDTALEIYKEGMGKSRFHPVPFAERVGRVYLITERYNEAKAHFARIITANNPELRETGLFYDGLMLAFVGEYETARDTLASLAETNPSSQFTNDAIEVSWLLEEGLRGDQRALGAYVKALHAELADDTVRVVDALTKTIEYGAGAPLRGRALIKLGEAFRGQERLDEALKMFETFCKEYPDDIRVADVRRKIGELYEEGYGNMDLALETYEDILLSYPHYLFLDEVREDVTRIRKITEHQ